MLLEVDVDDTTLQSVIKAAVKDFIHDSASIRHQVRQAIYEIVAKEVNRVVKDEPGKLAKLVLEELQSILKEEDY